jgi:ATP-dependent DNA helicase RecG
VAPGELPLGGLGGGEIDLVWFNQPYLLDLLRPGVRLYAYGQVRLHRGLRQMSAPEFELDVATDEPVGEASPHVGRIVPVYPLTKGVGQRFLRGLVHRLLGQDLDLGTGPHERFRPGGLSRLEAYRSLHFPSSWDDIQRARERFVFDEYFSFASHLHFRRRSCRQERRRPFTITEELDEKIRSVFPFRFTADQDRAVEEIVRDLGGRSCMYRLLQGDVGTGKTAVALYAMLVAVRNGCQAALMAPTEILAEQHHRTISRYLGQHPVRIALLTGSVSPAARRDLRQEIAEGKAHIVLGTHALVQRGVEFRNLGLVVIDEQHRFGVRERMRLRRKGDRPHVLVMTATPIPRSLCLTSYGDLDLSVLKERPEGREAVKTYLVRQRERSRAMGFIRREIVRGRQAYFVYPLIDESESLALPAAKEAHAHLSGKVFPEYRVGLVHGKLSAAQKEAELARFRSGEVQILVATVVVEVGIDVPNATVLFIEDASRFGLAQLHQLRGRVGRGGHPGICLVGVDSTAREVRARLKAFASTLDGFRIAEEDLRLRGPGDYLGVRQSGRPHFLLGNPLENLEEFLRVKSLADAFWADPGNAPCRSQWRELLGEEAQTEAEEGFLGLD